MLSSFANLKLSVRLGIAFGGLIAPRLIIAAP